LGKKGGVKEAAKEEKEKGKEEGSSCRFRQFDLLSGRKKGIFKRGGRGGKGREGGGGGGKRNGQRKSPYPGKRGGWKKKKDVTWEGGKGRKEGKREYINPYIPTRKKKIKARMERPSFLAMKKGRI